MKYFLVIILFLFTLQFNFAQDQPNGPYQEFYDSGELKKEGHYKNNKRVGNWKRYYKNGQISKDYSYTDGKYNLEAISYYKNGIVSLKTIKEDNVYIRYKYYESGKLKYKRQYKSGYYIGFYESGGKKIEATYLDFDLVGEWKKYYETGELEWSVNYKNGYRNGPYKKYSKNGDLILEGNNLKDKVDGEEKRYSLGNVLEWKGNYREGILNKSWIKLDAKGNIVEKIKIKDGVTSNLAFADILKPTKVPEGITERIPIYPGCEKSLTNKKRKSCMNKNVTAFISKNFNLELAKILPTGKKRIFVKFKANKNGEIEVLNVTGPSLKLKLEAYRVIKMLPKVLPAVQDGKIKTFQFSIPIVFQVQM